MKLEQAKQLKAAGYPQGDSLMVWVLSDLPRRSETWYGERQDACVLVGHARDDPRLIDAPGFDELMADLLRRHDPTDLALEKTGLLWGISSVGFAAAGLGATPLDALIEWYCKLSKEMSDG